MSLLTNCTSTGKLTPEILENQVSIIFDEDLILGTITVEKTLVHLFYLGNIEKEKQRLYKKALKQAKKTYEDDIELCNLTFNSKFSLSSLYLNGLGFVEDFSLSAYVVSKSKRQNKRRLSRLIPYRLTIILEKALYYKGLFSQVCSPLTSTLPS